MLQSKLIKAFLFVIITLYSFCGCAPRIVYKDVPIEIVKFDSVAYHDTIVNVKLEVIKDSITVKEDSSFLSNKYAYSYAKYDSIGLHHSLGIFQNTVHPIVINLPTKTKYIEKQKIVREPVEIYKQTGFQDFQSKAFWILIIIVIAILKFK